MLHDINFAWSTKKKFDRVWIIFFIFVLTRMVSLDLEAMWSGSKSRKRPSGTLQTLKSFSGNWTVTVLKWITMMLFINVQQPISVLLGTQKAVHRTAFCILGACKHFIPFYLLYQMNTNMNFSYFWITNLLLEVTGVRANMNRYGFFACFQSRCTVYFIIIRKVQSRSFTWQISTICS